MLLRVLTIALNTYREAVRARVLHGLVGLAIATTLYSLVVGAYALRDAPRVVADLGASSISIYAIAVAVLLAASSLHRELEYKTIFPVLARPIRRHEYVLGKYVGTVLTLVAFVALDATLVMLILAALGGRPTWLVGGIGVLCLAVLAAAVVRGKRWGTYAPLPWAVGMLVVSFWLASVSPDPRRVVIGMAVLTICEVSIVAAIATAFSSFTSPFLTAVFTLGIFVMGRQADVLANLPEKIFGPWVHSAGVVLSRVVPNLNVYVPARSLLTGEAPGVSLGAHLGWGGVQALGWALGLLVVAALIFRKRDFL